MKRFAAMHDCPVLIVRALTPSVDGGLQIRCRHDDERIASAELENGFLDQSRRSAGHVAPGPLAAGQRYCFHARVVN